MNADHKKVIPYPQQSPSADMDDLDLKEWPKFSPVAYPDIVGEFVTLATDQSEADRAAVCVTMLTRFAAEVYGYAKDKGPHIQVGETIHPPRLFVVICGNITGSIYY
jgi:hypothetical protein